MYQSPLLQDLHDRGLIAQMTDAATLDQQLGDGLPLCCLAGWQVEQCGFVGQGHAAPCVADKGGRWQVLQAVADEVMQLA